MNEKLKNAQIKVTCCPFCALQDALDPKGFGGHTGYYEYVCKRCNKCFWV